MVKVMPASIILMGTQEADAVKAAACDDNEGGGHAGGLTGS